MVPPPSPATTPGGDRPPTPHLHPLGIDARPTRSCSRRGPQLWDFSGAGAAGAGHIPVDLGKTRARPERAATPLAGLFYRVTNLYPSTPNLGIYHYCFVYECITLV
jgi:hypothetical protein